jgi:hypothetical protein
MEIKDKPATGTPARLLGVLLLIGGGLFIGNFVYAIGMHSPSITAASITAWGIYIVGMVGGGLLVGVGIAAMLHSMGQLQLAESVGWES